MRKLIPIFMDAGVDGFLPMDINAGMDVVSVVFLGTCLYRVDINCVGCNENRYIGNKYD